MRMFGEYSPNAKRQVCLMIKAKIYIKKIAAEKLCSLKIDLPLFYITLGLMFAAATCGWYSTASCSLSFSCDTAAISFSVSCSVSLLRTR